MSSYWQTILDTSIMGMMNTQWNYGLEKMAYNASLFSSPLDSPTFLLDPRLALWQTQQSWQNNPSAAGGWGNTDWSNVQMPGWTAPWQVSSSSSDSSSSSSSKNTAAQKEIKKLKEVVDAVKKIAEKDEGFLAPEILDELNAAFSNTREETDEDGKTKKVKKTDEEKLADIKAAMKKIGAKKLKHAILQNPELKEKMKLAGYNFINNNSETRKPTQEEKAKDKDINDDITKLYTGIGAGKYDEFAQTVGSTAMASDNILQYISTWNDSHNGDDERCILRYLAKNYNKDSKKGYPEAVKRFTETLCSKANEYTDTYPTIKTKKEALEKAQTTFDKEFEKADEAKVKSMMQDLAVKFEALYAQIRMQEAEIISKEIKDKYGALNKIVQGTIPDDIIVASTKADLKNEKVNTPSAEKVQGNEYEDNNDNSEKPAEERVQALTGSGDLIETDKSKNGEYGDVKLYKSKGKDENGHPQYFTVVDDKLVKLNGIVKSDGKLYDSNEKALCDIKTGLKPAHYTTFKDSEIITEDQVATWNQDINDTKYKEKIDKLKENGILETTDSTDPVVYHSKEWNRFYTIKDGKLYRLKDVTEVTKNGFVKLSNGSEVSVKQAIDKPADADAMVNKLEKKNSGGNSTNYSDYENGTENYETAFNIGKAMNHNITDSGFLGLGGGTHKSDGDKFMENLKSVNKYNIKAVIEGYEDTRGWFGEDICNQIMNENGEDMNYRRLQAVVKLIQYTIEYAEDNISTVNEEKLNELKSIYDVLKYAVYDDGDTSKTPHSDKYLRYPTTEENDFSKAAKEQIEKLRKDVDTDDSYFKNIDDLIYGILSVKRYNIITGGD